MRARIKYKVDETHHGIFVFIRECICLDTSEPERRDKFAHKILSSFREGMYVSGQVKKYMYSLQTDISGADPLPPVYFLPDWLLLSRLLLCKHCLGEL